MEIMESGEPFLQWDRNLSELSDTGDNDNMLYSTHFTELLDDLSQEALLGQLLSDPFLSGRGDAMDTEEELTPASPVPPLIQAEHSYSLCGDSRPQSPLSHLPGEPGSDAGDSDNDDWPMEQEDRGLKMEPLLGGPPTLLPTLTLTMTPEGPASEPVTTASDPTLSMTLPHTAQIKPPNVKKDSECFSPQIKLEPHEVDQFLNISPKGLESLQMPPTPPSSHGSDSEGSQSPVHPCAPASPTQTPAVLKVAPRVSSSLSNSPLLTAPHKLQGSGPLLLTEEEKRTLIAEGYPVPTKLPLSKAEEKALKKIRRKIKNKISAQESRRKKKEYMDALEKKVETCSSENNELRRKVETLECTNKSLLQQLHSLQAVVAGKVPRSCRVTGTQTSTCLMVVVLCFSVFLGSFYQGLSPCSSVTKTGLTREISIQESYTATVKSRNLLAFEERGGLDDPHFIGLGGEYPEWDQQVDVMAAWRLEQQHKQEQAESHEAEPRPLLMNTNETHAQKSILLDLHSHRSDKWSNETAKVIELERTVNETS
ncbi:cyclic AMP-responsive element-binding protein 3-like protein 2 isoform X2 [Myxocyprinus asiaticus]|uniref:cyclic AMP-responsive element-binding protein 3-like protein 2 isoform X2 n=1 Tax=Myxocyprinus asiaticus TaxID=70543 RepID=UPI002222CF10|nr:cyclic AMP-responsive element-binding protein 3-like protein 2 isoform X2 [Myxocyprinus asiaticus]